MSNDLTLDYYLKTGWQSVANKYNHIASRYGITQAMGFVLINIHKEGTPVTQIAGLLGVKATSLSRMLNNLEDLGLVYRRVNDADKRSSKVFLTPLGVEKRRIAKQVIKDFNAFLESQLSIDEREVLVRALQRINQVASMYNPMDKETDYYMQLKHIENE